MTIKRDVIASGKQITFYDDFARGWKNLKLSTGFI